eukprot:Nitzschia sp. Nitz4//scaffold3_size479765//190781//192183//NITZ4_000077-RA/size479765-processed-gene-1.444-mRNA-1//-1//CDS//3329550689//3907//frame0
MPPPRFTLFAGASAIFLVGMVTWRARKRSAAALEQAERMVSEGPMIDVNDTVRRKQVIEDAKHRASKWLSYKVSGADHMVGQIGGISSHKRRMLKLDPDFILKPLQLDHRGIRELAFYEGLVAASHTKGTMMYKRFTSVKGLKEPSIVDVLAFWVALRLGEPYVLECERKIMDIWKEIDHEAEILRRLFRFIPPYFGMVRHKIPNPLEISEEANEKCPFGIELDCHLLLQDATHNFHKPCVIDLKMGKQSFEPDAPDDKRQRESSKYPQQGEFGFRVVGHRVYKPDSDAADKHGFVFCNKAFGRSLSSRDTLKECLVDYLGLRYVHSTILQARLKAVTNILLEVRSLQHWFRENTKFGFFASSLLIAYEGDEARTANLDVVTVKMIDFGRVRRQKGGDPGYLKGLKTLCTILEEILTEREAEMRASPRK